MEWFFFFYCSLFWVNHGSCFLSIRISGSSLKSITVSCLERQEVSLPLRLWCRGRSGHVPVLSSAVWASPVPVRALRPLSSKWGLTCPVGCCDRGVTFYTKHLEPFRPTVCAQERLERSTLTLLVFVCEPQTIHRCKY